MQKDGRESVYIADYSHGRLSVLRATVDKETQRKLFLSGRVVIVGTIDDAMSLAKRTVNKDSSRVFRNPQELWKWVVCETRRLESKGNAIAVEVMPQFRKAELLDVILADPNGATIEFALRMLFPWQQSLPIIGDVAYRAYKALCTYFCED